MTSQERLPYVEMGACDFNKIDFHQWGEPRFYAASSSIRGQLRMKHLAVVAQWNKSPFGQVLQHYDCVVQLKIFGKDVSWLSEVSPK